jgi:hypothetical protein
MLPVQAVDQTVCRLHAPFTCSTDVLVRFVICSTVYLPQSADGTTTARATIETNRWNIFVILHP